jgi:hypothetical protein
MENQTRYDLGAAIENWQAELAAQANLTPEVRRELEAHLRDAIAGFQQRGLTEEESFWLARRRVGQPQRLGEEFVKVDPAGVWRERAFWLAFGLLTLRLWNMLLFSIFSAAAYYGGSGSKTVGEFLPRWIAFYVPEWLDNLRFMPYFPLFLQLVDQLFVVAIIVLLARGQMGKMRLFFEFAFKNRFQFSAVMTGLMIFAMVASICLSSVLMAPGWHPNFIANDFSNALGVMVLLIVCSLLLPGQNQKRPKHA